MTKYEYECYIKETNVLQIAIYYSEVCYVSSTHNTMLRTFLVKIYIFLKYNSLFIALMGTIEKYEIQ